MEKEGEGGRRREKEGEGGRRRKTTNETCVSARWIDIHTRSQRTHITHTTQGTPATLKNM